MEAYITPHPLPTHAHPLTRLLAAILAFLRALLAEHQAGLLPTIAPSAPRHRPRTNKTAKSHTTRRPRRRTPQTQAPTQARAHTGMPTHAQQARDMTAGLPRPRLIGPH